MVSSGHVAFYPAFAQIEGRGVQLWSLKTTHCAAVKHEAVKL